MNIKSHLKDKIIKYVFTIPEWSVLVINRQTARILTTIFKRTEILSHNILSLQRIETQRDKIDYPAVYFVYYDNSFSKKLKSDLKQDLYQKYLVIHINEVETKLEEERVFYKFFDLHFVVISDMVITPLYLTEFSEKNQHKLKKSEKIKRERLNDKFNAIKSLSKLFHLDLNTINLSSYDNIEKFFITNQKRTESSDLIILDRWIDLFAPLIHSFEFEVISRDLNLIASDEEDRNEAKKEENAQNKEKDNKNDNDDKKNDQNKNIEKKNDELLITKSNKIDLNTPLWYQINHLHIAEVNQFLREKAHSLVSSFKKIDKKSNISDLRALVLEAPENIQTKKSLDGYITVAESLLKEYERVNLSVIANIEQCIVTGYTPSGKKYYSGINDLFKLLESDRSIKRSDLIRIIYLLVSNKNDLENNEIKKLKDKLLLSKKELQTIEFLKTVRNKQKIRKEFFHKYVYEISRYRPVLIDLLESYTNKSKIFSKILKKNKKPDSLRQSTFLTKSNKIKKKTIIILIDTISYKELLFIQQFTKNNNLDVLVCTDKIVTPIEYAEWLEDEAELLNA